MNLVVIESPYAGKSSAIWPIGPILRWWRTRQNVKYLRACMHEALVKYGEAPYASHAIYTQPGVLDDTIESERAHGIRAGFAWGEKAPKRVFYVDHGWSMGMRAGLAEAYRLDQEIEFRTLYGTPLSPPDVKKPRRASDGAPVKLVDPAD